MPYFDTSEQWLKQSSLLLQARPSTVRNGTIYLRSYTANHQLKDTHNYEIQATFSSEDQKDRRSR